MRRGRLDQRVEQALMALLDAEESLKVLAEQITVWTEMRDELKTRALVAETPLAAAELNEMERQLAVAASALQRQREEVGVRRALHDELVEKWQPEEVV